MTRGFWTIPAVLALALSAGACGDQTVTGDGLAEPSEPNTTRATTPASSPTTTTNTSTGTVRFEATGSGTAYSVDWDPGEEGVADRQTSVPLPWSGEFPDPGDVEIYQLVIVGGENVGCRILIDGEEVASEPPGGSAHCTYQP